MAVQPVDRVGEAPPGGWIGEVLAAAGPELFAGQPVPSVPPDGLGPDHVSGTRRLGVDSEPMRCRVEVAG